MNTAMLPVTVIRFQILRIGYRLSLFNLVTSHFIYCCIMHMLYYMRLQLMEEEVVSASAVETASMMN